MSEVQTTTEEVTEMLNEETRRKLREMNLSEMIEAIDNQSQESAPDISEFLTCLC